MDNVLHRLECGHSVEVPRGNRASHPREQYCEPCRGHMAVLGSEVTVGPNIIAPVEEVKTSNDIDIAADATPEIHSEIASDDEPL